MSLAVAIAVATVSALFNTPFARYSYWFSWSPGSAIIGIVTYLVLEGGGGGGSAWLIAQQAGATPDGPLWWRGLMLGIVGALTFRADLAPKSSDSPADPADGGATATGIKSLLTFGAKWTSDGTDYATTRAIQRYFRRLTTGKPGADDSLLWHAEEVRARIDQDTTVPRDTVDLMNNSIGPMIATLGGSPGTVTTVQARAQLSAFCANHYARGNHPKPRT